MAKARKLIEKDQVECLIGGSLTSTIYATLPVVVSARTPYLVAMGGGAEVTRKKRRNPFTYRTSYNIWQVGYPFGKYVAEKVTQQVYMTASDYAAGHEWKEAFKAGFSGAGGTIVGEIYPLLGSPDFVPYLTKIAQEGPEGLCAWFVGSDAIRFLQAYDQLGLRQKTKLLMFGRRDRLRRAPRHQERGGGRGQPPLVEPGSQERGERAAGGHLHHPVQEAAQLAAGVGVGRRPRDGGGGQARGR